MPLFHIQDSDRSMFVVAADYETAVAQWRNQMVEENEGTQAVDHQPQGIQWVVDDDEIMVDGIVREDFLKAIRPPVEPQPEQNSNF